MQTWHTLSSMRPAGAMRTKAAPSSPPSVFVSAESGRRQRATIRAPSHAAHSAAHFPRVQGVVLQKSTRTPSAFASRAMHLGSPFLSSTRSTRLAHRGKSQTRRTFRAAQGESSDCGSTALETKKLSAAVGKFLIDQYLPLGLIAAIALGCIAPVAGCKAAELGVATYSTVGIFVLSGLGINTKEIKRALQAWGAWIYGAVFILLLSPVVSMAILQIPLAPRELVVGLAVFCCMPTTLTSGVSLTQAAGGNAALALGLTVGTNILGIMTMPFVLSSVLGQGGAVNLPPGPLLSKLVQTILIPVILGNAARSLIPKLAAWVDTNKKLVSLMTSTLLVMQPWMQVSRVQPQLLQLDMGALAVVSAVWVVVHLAYMGFNTLAAQFLKLGANLGDRKWEVDRAIIIVASQKTLPVCVAVMQQLPVSVIGGVGLCLIPCITAHLLQIVIDSVIVGRMVKHE